MKRDHRRAGLQSLTKNQYEMGLKKGNVKERRKVRCLEMSAGALLMGDRDKRREADE
jgi:hypothetical protein